MYILKQSPRGLGLDEPIRHDSHKRPTSRRDFIAQGFMTGPAVVAAPSLLSLIMSSKAAAMSPDLDALKQGCNITAGAGKIPFICFDLAGGAAIAGSDILAGTGSLTTNFLSTAGYAKQGLPGNMTPNSPNAASTSGNFVSTEFGAAWHSDGAILRGMQGSTQVATRANVHGFPIAARSENDTSNNPHNPMYGINRIGADGQLLTLIGSQNSDSGGNSMAPAAMMDPAVRPTKVDRASDVTGLVDTGELGTLFTNTDDAVAVLESMTRLGHVKVSKRNTLVADDRALKELVRCGYVKSTYLADQFRDKAALNPDLDPMIVGPTGIFTQAEYNADNEFRKTAAVMKMVISGYAGAGTVTMGGYDYHGQGRDTAETRNFRAGRCIGACLEYAARRNVPVVVYVFSDGSLSANGVVNNSALGRGKLDYASDNQSTACPFMLVYNPRGRPTLRDQNRNQVGSFSMQGDVLTASSPAGNAVNLLVETVLLNYMALHGEAGNFDQPAFFPKQGLGSIAQREALTIFNPIVNGTVSNPI